MKSLGENANSLPKKWVALTKADTDLLSIQLSDSERKGYVPRVLDAVVAILDGGEITSESRNVAALHGETRLKQGYSARLLLREAKLLQDAIAACIHRNLLEIEISSLTPDMVRAFGNRAEPSGRGDSRIRRTTATSVQPTVKKKLDCS